MSEPGLPGAGATELTVRVYFEDTDFSGRVYHGAYVRFLERGRTEHLRVRGLDHTSLARQAEPVYFTLRALNLSFRGPAQIDDLLTVRTAVAALSGATILMRQEILAVELSLVTAEAELCLIDGLGRPRRLPQAVRTAFGGKDRGSGAPQPLKGT